MKKLIAAVLTISALATLTACNKTPGPEPETPETTTQTTTAPETTEVPETTEAITLAPTEVPADPSPDDRISYYDESGHEYIQETYRSEDGITTISFYRDQVLQQTRSWNTDGYPVTFTTYLQGKPIWRNSFSYNELGELSSYHSDVLNEQGNPVKKISLQGGRVYGDGIHGYEYFEGGTEQWCRSYTYDNNGQLSAEEQEDIFAERLFHFYDEAGNLLATFNPRTGQEYEAFYDEQGRITNETDYCDPEEATTEYFYDENGLKTGHYIGATYGSGDLIYDEQGKLVLNIFYGDGAEEFRTTYCYNDQGDLVEEIHTDAYTQTVTHRTYKYQYRSNGQWTEKICYSDGAVEERFTRVYNEAGLVVEETENEVTSTYTYDDQGQMTQKLVTTEGSTNVRCYLYNRNDQGNFLEEICYQISKKARS